MEEQELGSTTWSHPQKIAFRFFFIFFGLFIFPFPLNSIPGSDVIFGFYNDFWTWMINIVGTHLVGLEEPLELKFTGSGDGMYSWVMNLTILLLSIIGTGIWSWLDWGRSNYEKLQWWLLLFVTYYVASSLFFYGIVKVFYLQFVAPNLERLFQTFGQASPMRLLWTFMGFSETYTMFSGWCETLAALLLVFRRTRTLGGLTAFAVMLNVFLLNMSYDVPVKLYSFQLMIMGLYIGLQDHERLLGFFLLNKPIQPANHAMPIQSKRWVWLVLGLQVLVAGYSIVNPTRTALDGRKAYGSEREKSALYGIYNTETFVHNQDTLAPLLTDTVRWKRVLMDYPNFISVIKMDDKVERYQSEIDTAAQQISLHLAADTANKFLFTYAKTEDSMRLEGVIDEDTLSVDLLYYDPQDMGLLGRGFHWVNEVPYNRYKYE